MPYDFYEKLNKPDMQVDLPQWMDLGQKDQTPDVSPFVSALKKRMAVSPATGDTGATMGKAISGGEGRMSL